MNELTKLIDKEIQKPGIIPFARFMELALYCPKIGYYERQEHAIGRKGDFYTSVSVGPLFGQLLAYEFAQWAASVPGTVIWLEAGAHNGQLAYDILDWLSQNRAELLDRLEYWLLEPSPTRQQWQHAKLEKFAALVHWSHSFAPFGDKGLQGIIFSNELLDAFPVHRLGWDAQGQKWFEWGVALQGEQFIWQPMTGIDCHEMLAEAGLNYPPEVWAQLPQGFTIEVSPAAANWWKEAAGILRRGKILTIDYGLSAEEIITPQRAGGTLRSYYRHHLAANPLANPGDQDLTAHVNFTHLQSVGEATGLRTEGLFAQAQFLTAIAGKIWAEKEGGAWDTGQVQQFQTLTHPQWLGRAFRVLIQSR